MCSQYALSLTGLIYTPHFLNFLFIEFKIIIHLREDGNYTAGCRVFRQNTITHQSCKETCGTQTKLSDLTSTKYPTVLK